MTRLLARSLISVGSIAGIAAFSLIASVSSGQAAGSAPHWRIVKTFGPAGQASRLLAVTATGPANAWAAGDLCEGCTPSPRLAVQHWNGKSWNVRKLPATIAQSDYGVVSMAASSNSNVWIISDTALGAAAVRLTGSKWTATKLPSWVVRVAFGSGLVDNTVLDFGSRNVWDFSLGAATLPTVAARFNGHLWRKTFMPTMPLHVSAVSANDIWAVGPTRKTMHLPLTQQTDIAMHWNGHFWKSIRVPRVRSTAVGGYVSGMVAQSPKQLWLGVPTGGTIGNLRGLLLHWNGSRWAHVFVPRGVFNFPTGAPIVQDGHGGLWMQRSGPAPNFPLYLYRYNHGHWTRYLMPDGNRINLLSFAWIPGTTKVWAVGLDTAFPANTVKALIAGFGT